MGLAVAISCRTARPQTRPESCVFVLGAGLGTVSRGGCRSCGLSDAVRPPPSVSPEVTLFRRETSAEISPKGGEADQPCVARRCIVVAAIQARIRSAIVCEAHGKRVTSAEGLAKLSDAITRYVHAGKGGCCWFLGRAREAAATAVPRYFAISSGQRAKPV